MIPTSEHSDAADRVRLYLVHSDDAFDLVIARAPGLRDAALRRGDLAALLRERDEAVSGGGLLFRQHEDLMVDLCAVLGLNYVAGEQDVLRAVEACKAGARSARGA